MPAAVRLVRPAAEAPPATRKVPAPTRLFTPAKPAEARCSAAARDVTCKVTLPDAAVLVAATPSTLASLDVAVGELKEAAVLMFATASCSLVSSVLTEPQAVCWPRA